MMMMLLSFIPDWIFYATLLLGVIGTVLVIAFGWIIPIEYKLGIQILSAFLLTIGAFFVGGASNEARWQLNVKEMESKVAQQEVRASEITTEVITKYIERIKIVEGKTHEIIKKVPIYITKKSDDECIINNGAIVLHDSSASQTEVPNTSGNINEEPSNVKLSEVISTVSQNYGTYYQVVEQLKSLQAWINNQKDLDDGK